MADLSTRVAAMLFVLFCVSGCSSNSTIESVAVFPKTVYVVAGQAIQFTAMIQGGRANVRWSVNGVVGGSAATGTIDANGHYSAPSIGSNAKVTVEATSAGKSDSAVVSIIPAGLVTTTNEPQVARYTIDPPADANVTVEFGTDTTYGRTTWTQATPPGGGLVNIYVAGMLPNTLYHMRAVIQFTGSSTVDDSDHTFTTSSFPAAALPTLSASTTPGMVSQSGVELLSLLNTPGKLTAEVTDLAGNVLWGYNPQLSYGAYSANPVELLPNGNFLMNFSGNPDGYSSVIREVDLGGNVVWKMTAGDLNQALANATCSGCNTITVIGTHHDIGVLPNGHLILIASEEKSVSGLIGEPDPVTVDGDVLIDLDQNRKPVWVWSEFDHLDLNRHPWGLPDWTHTNAVVYSPSDKDLIISSRHQSWIMKIDYDDGQGSGNILWKLGYQGDFTLMNGNDPVDWQYAQHDANVSSSNSSGTFEMTMFDNGDNREMDNGGDVCGASGQPACYSRIPIIQIDEAAKTATLEWIDNLSPVYANWGGNARVLENGNIEFDECGLTGASAIYEVTKTTPPQTMWQMQITGQNAYRGYRIPSLYPGVQW